MPITTPTATEALDTFLDAVAAAAPKARVIRNDHDLAHVAKPRRSRATWVITVTREGRVDGTLLNGQGHVIGSWSDVTVDEIVSQVAR